MSFVNKYFDKFTVLDKYILRQVFEVFLLGMTIFTGLMFASEPFLRLVKEISNFGMPVHIAVMIVLLNLPALIVLAIPMSSLFATILVLNKLCLGSEITVLRACGIGLNRISASILVSAVFLTGLSFFINETIVPITNEQSKTLALWSLGQKNVPNGKHNFVLKEEGDDYKLKRLFFVDKCKDDKLYNIVVLDMSSDDETSISYAKNGRMSSEGWVLEEGIYYKVNSNGLENSTNTIFNRTTVDFGLDLKDEVTRHQIREYNIIAMHRYLKELKENKSDQLTTYKIMYYEKFAIPATTIVLVLIGIPLSITPPRARFNRGILFSILILFVYYVIRAFSISLGEAGNLPAIVAVWLPNIIVGAFGLFLYWRKVYKIT